MASIGGLLLVVMVWMVAGVLLISTMGAVDEWHRDAVPDAEQRKSLARSGYPASISRTISAGVSSRFNGDGERLEVYCFSPVDVPLMQKALGDGAEWKPGLGDNFSPQSIRSYLPDELSPGRRPAEDFLHLTRPPGALDWILIDVKRGISYRFSIQT